MNLLRRALGEQRLTYLGFSYGSFLGATFAKLFPHRYRAMVLDGPLDANEYINRPLSLSAHQVQGLERALRRFLKACAADQAACHNFGGADPAGAFDRLAARLDRSPLPATGYPLDPRPVDGDDLRVGTAITLYSKQAWPAIGAALAAARRATGPRSGGSPTSSTSGSPTAPMTRAATASSPSREPRRAIRTPWLATCGRGGARGGPTSTSGSSTGTASSTTASSRSGIATHSTGRSTYGRHRRRRWWWPRPSIRPRRTPAPCTSCANSGTAGCSP